ncbi:hypothetical protein EDM59_12825 [Brevibacillus nitrificans]|uniref:Uncharacterized protein n=1 Tax=Brevibacillus nitrificans TaxID=651560 RepID=A0A3M8DB67_9BACL|nr:hypothetical protein EDM59_12825 [Brevibacillus nitrificans]
MVEMIVLHLAEMGSYLCSRSLTEKDATGVFFLFVNAQVKSAGFDLLFIRQTIPRCGYTRRMMLVLAYLQA